MALSSCSSFDEIASVGMNKQDFVGAMSRNEMAFRSLYFDSKAGIEVWVPVRAVKYSLSLNSSAKIAIFENVTRPPFGSLFRP